MSVGLLKFMRVLFLSVCASYQAYSERSH